MSAEFFTVDFSKLTDTDFVWDEELQEPEQPEQQNEVSVSQPTANGPVLCDSVENGSVCGAALDPDGQRDWSCIMMGHGLPPKHPFLSQASQDAWDDSLRGLAEAEPVADPEAEKAALVERLEAMKREERIVRIMGQVEEYDEAKSRVTAKRQGENSAEDVIDGLAFMLSASDTIPAIWGDGNKVLWADGEALLVAGPPGVGKTTITMQVVKALLVGGTVLDLPVQALQGTEKVLYLACDRPAQIARRMRQGLAGVPSKRLAAGLAVQQGSPGMLDADPELLLRLARKHGASVVVVDSLKDMASDVMSDKAGMAINKSIQLCVAAGINVLAMHHLRKSGGPNGEAPTKLADVYGSAFITAGAGSVVLIWGNAGDTDVTVKHLKQPGDVVGPLKVHHDHATCVSTVTDASGSGAAGIDLVKLKGVYDLILGSPDITQNKLTKSAVMRDAVLKVYVQELEDRGMIEVRKVGTSNVHRVTGIWVELPD